MNAEPLLTNMDLIMYMSVLNSLMVRKGDSHPSVPGSIPGSGGWGLAYRHLCIYVNVNKSVISPLWLAFDGDGSHYNKQNI